MATRKTETSEIKLYPESLDIKKEWYVGFRHTNPLTLERRPFQVRMGINYQKTLTTRKAEATIVIGLIRSSLSNGWDPFSEKIEDYLHRVNFQERIEADKNRFVNVLWDIYNAKKISFSKKSNHDISCVIRFAETAANNINISNKHIRDVTRSSVKELLDEMGRIRQVEYDKAGRGQIFTGNAYNKYKEYLKLLFSEMEERELIEYNPCSKIKDRKEITTNIHRHATMRERELILKELKKPENLPFYYFVALEHATGIRPCEMFALQVKDIDYINSSLLIRPEDGKTDSFRMVPVPDYIFNYILDMVSNFSDEHYIFGQDFKPNIDKKPRSDYASRRWKRLIKDGLGVNVSLYSFKGLGGEDKRKVGIDIGTVSAGFGHSSLNMTKIYLHGEQDRINEELRTKTPEL